MNSTNGGPSQPQWALKYFNLETELLINFEMHIQQVNRCRNQFSKKDPTSPKHHIYVLGT